MSQNCLRHVMKRIRRTIYHLGVFDGSIPAMREEAPEYTRAYLTVLQDCLPDLKHLLRFAAETVPVIGRMVGLVDRGTTDLARASETLREVKRSTQRAVDEIMNVLDRVNPLLDQVSKVEGGSRDTQQMLKEARGQLLLILNALQFQDITAQQIEATNSVLADLGKGLGSLMEGLGEGAANLPQIQVSDGAFDPHATFDRQRAGVDQQAIDALLDGGVVASAGAAEAEAGEPPGNGHPGNEAAADAMSAEAALAAAPDAGQPVDQDDIDALISSAQGG